MKQITKLFLILFLAIQSIALWAQDTIPDAVYDFGDSLGVTVSNGDMNFVNARFNVKRLLDKVLQAPEGNDEIKDFNTGFSGSILKSNIYGNILLNSINQGFYFDFINAYIDSQGSYHVVFRLFSPDEGLNYHDLLLEEGEKGYEIIDLYPYISGEYLSKTFKRLYMSALVDLLNSDWKVGNNELGVEQLVTLKKLKDEGKYQEAYELFHQLPKDVQENKLFQLYYVMVSGKLSDKIYEDAITKYKKLFPKDPSLNLVLIDGYVIKKQYKKALDAIDNLEAIVQGDEMLDFIRGNVSIQMGKFDIAESYYQSVLTNFPYFSEAADQLLYVLLEQEKEQDAIKCLEHYIEYLEVSKEDLIDHIERNYLVFSDSEVFKSWKKGSAK